MQTLHNYFFKMNEMKQMANKRILLLICAVLLGIPSHLLFAREKPNIILFLVDDTDKYQLGCYGAPVYTPNIDQLAAEGLMFHNAHVNSTVCTPSRYGLTTGRFAGRSTYEGYLDDYPEGTQGHPEFNVGLEQDFMNIGHALQTAGYTTGWVGKFHLHTDETMEGELTSDENQFLANASPEDPEATALFKREERAYRDYIINKGFGWASHIYEGNLKEPFKAHNLEWTIEAALDFIDSAANEPFYLHFNTTLLHGPDGEWERSMNYPRYTGEGLIDRELEAEMPARSTVIERITSNGYNLKDNPAGITWLDDGVGAVMRKLKELGIEDNTVLVFLPDHGSANKASLFSKDGTNIPMIIRYPEMITAGSESHSLVQAIDLLPTFYELGGVELPENYQLDGTSLTSLFGDPETKVHESIYFELGCARGVMTDQYKYVAVRYTQDRINDILSIPEAQLKEKVIRKLIYLDGHVGISSRGIKYSPEYLSPDQLYDWTTDPDELHNLAGNPAHTDALEYMKGLLKGYLESFPGRPFGEFVPGPNAAPPHPDVVKYINNIQYALENGATLNKDVIVCNGNCVLEGEGTSGQATYEIPVRITQGPDHISIVPVHGAGEIKLFDIGGRELSHDTCNARDRLVYSTTRFNPGVYLLTMDIEGSERICKKLIIN